MGTNWQAKAKWNKKEICAKSRSQLDSAPSPFCEQMLKALVVQLWPTLCNPMDCSLLLSMEFSRQEYWSGLSCPPPGDLPGPGIKPASPASQVNSLPLKPPGKPRILEWVAIPFSRGSTQPRDQTQDSLIAGRFFTVWAMRETLVPVIYWVVYPLLILKPTVERLPAFPFLMFGNWSLEFGSVRSSCSVMFSSLRPHGLQHARLPYPSPTPRACSNSYPSSRVSHLSKVHGYQDVELEIPYILVL